MTRQIECLAGVIYRRSGFEVTSLHTWFRDEPFVGSHWGRDPLRIGPKVRIGLDVRDEWFLIGQNAEDPSACAVPELPVELLLERFQG